MEGAVEAGERAAREVREEAGHLPSSGRAVFLPSDISGSSFPLYDALMTYVKLNLCFLKKLTHENCTYL